MEGGGGRVSEMGISLKSTQDKQGKLPQKLKIVTLKTSFNISKKSVLNVATHLIHDNVIK